LDHR